MISSYPKEFYIKLENNEHLLGRLTLNMSSSLLHVEIDIVFEETKKIYKHIYVLYNQVDENEAINNALQFFSNYLRNPSV